MTKSIAIQRTIKILIDTLLRPEDKQSIHDTIRDCKVVFDFFVALGKEHKSTSYTTLHKYGYQACKALSPNLPTALLQQTAKNALASLKSFNANYKNYNLKRERQNKKSYVFNHKHHLQPQDKYYRQAKPLFNKWEYTGSKKANSYALNLLTLHRRGNLTTFSSSAGRIRLAFELPQWFSRNYELTKLQAGTILIDKLGRCYINLVYRVAVPSNRGSQVVGLDRGWHNQVTTSEAVFFSGKNIKRVKRVRQYNRKRLQEKGTKSAKQKLKKLAGKEKRFVLDVNHCVSKQLANNSEVKTYVFERLTHIRSHSKGTKSNRIVANWSFLDLEAKTLYKCQAKGIDVVYVDARYTSQKCSVCGNIDKSNRRGSRYHCPCGHKQHADLNASINIRNNYLVSLVTDPGCLQPTHSGEYV